MSLKAYNIDVPITPGVMPPVIHIGQYDSGRDYICHLKNDDGTDYTIPSGTTATFTGCNPRKEVFELEATVDTSANTITITPKDEATSMFGKYGATLNLTLNDEQMSPIVILMDVQKAGATDEEIAGAANFPDAVTEAVQDYVDQLREQGEAWPAKFICTFTTTAGVTTCDKTYAEVVEADTSQNIISCDSSEGAGWYAGIVDDSAVFYVVETGGGAPVLTRYELSASGVSVNYYSTSGGGLSDGAKNALLACLRGMPWSDPESSELYDNLEGELFPTADIASIYALFTQGSAVILPDASLDSLRQYLTVTAYYTDTTSRTVTGYTLSGTLAVGTSTITVSYRGKTSSFTVSVSAAENVGYISIGTPNISNNVLTPGSAGAVRSPVVFSPGDSPWKIRVGFTTGAVVNTTQDLLGTSDASGTSVRSFMLENVWYSSENRAAMSVYAASDASTGGWNIIYATVSAQMQPSTHYLMEVEFTGSAYRARTSTDNGATWGAWSTENTATKIASGYYLTLGIKRGGAYFGGTINLEETMAWIDDVPWWAPGA